MFEIIKGTKTKSNLTFVLSMARLEIVMKQTLKPTLKPCKAKNSKCHTFISYFVKPSVLKFKVYKTNNFFSKPSIHY